MDSEVEDLTPSISKGINGRAH